MIEATAREAWKELEAKLRPFVAHRVRSRSDVDDVLQDSFLRLQRSLPGLRDDERFGPWVYQIARSAIADYRRRSERHPFAAGPSSEDSLISEASLEDDNLAEQALAASVGRFIAMLPSPQREALTLTELAGASQKEAAEMLGVSLTCLKSRVLRGRQRLRELFEACCVIGLDPRGHVQSCEPRRGSPIARDCACDRPVAKE